MATWKVSTSIACALITLLLTSCSSAVSPPPAPSNTVTLDATKEPIIVLDYTEEPEAETETAPPIVLPDPLLTEEMSCEPVDPELLERVKLDFGTPTRSVQVHVGEGLEPGENWWVVILDSPPDDAYQWGLRSFLTTGPGLPGDGTWITLGTKNPWKSVHWEPEQLVVGQSALTKALDCLEN